MKRYPPLLVSLAGGLLLWAAWPASPFTLLIFVAWLPLLWLESIIKSRKRFFGLVYLTMLAWNIATTWWIWNASVPGAIAAFFANSLLMCLPWLGFKMAKDRLGEKAGYLSLVAFWMCFEYIHLQDWGLSWPWLTLGNVFAAHPSWIRWYEYTGTSGGTLWVLLVNLFLFLHIKNTLNKDTSRSYTNLLACALLLLLPLGLSWIGATRKNEAGTLSNIVVVQPNIDPYEKISSGTFEAQLQKLIYLSEQAIDDNTALVVWPETALYMGSGIEEDKMKENPFLTPLWYFLQRHPRLSLFTGIESYRVYHAKNSPFAKPLGTTGSFYEAYNGSVLLTSTGPLSFYHKSMLVPGVETLPWFLQFIDSWFEKFGGTTAGYAKQKERTVLEDSRHGHKIAPAICYESIYGEYMSRYVHNGANLICIITNDGWWGNTPGYRQHMNYARLRAIETGKWVARSANTGISCFIDPLGNVINPQPWNTTASVKLAVPVNNKQTFFVRHGDLLSKAAITLSVLLILLNIITGIRRRFKKP